MLFSDRSLWTMAHGIVLGGGALAGLLVAWFALYALRPDEDGAPAARAVDAVSRALWAGCGLLWLAVLTGTYVVFPPYRATPPAELANLSAYPRSMLLADPSTAWLHAFAMESKEHVPWIAAMLATAVAFVATRSPAALLTNPSVRRIAMALLAISVALVAFTALLGTFVNKVAPLQ